MTRLRRKYKIPTTLLPQLRLFVEEICEQSLQHGNMPIFLHTYNMEKVDEETYFHVEILGDAKIARSAIPLCLAAENGWVKIPSPVNPESRRIGKVGEKITFDGEVYSVVPITGGKFGTTYLHRIRDLFGNELYWKTNTKRYSLGSYSIIGKVRGFDTYDDVVQTRLSYCKLIRRNDA